MKDGVPKLCHDVVAPIARTASSWAAVGATTAVRESKSAKRLSVTPSMFNAPEVIEGRTSAETASAATSTARAGGKLTRRPKRGRSTIPPSVEPASPGVVKDPRASCGSEGDLELENLPLVHQPVAVRDLVQRSG